MVTCEELEKAYQSMKKAPNYMAFKDRKRHYEKLLKRARNQNKGE